MNEVFIHSFWIFLERLFKSTTTQRRSRHSTDTVSEFHAETPQATASEGLSQGPYVAARAGFEPTTLRSTGIDSPNELPRPTNYDVVDQVDPVISHLICLSLLLLGDQCNG